MRFRRAMTGAVSRTEAETTSICAGAAYGYFRSWNSVKRSLDSCQRCVPTVLLYMLKSRLAKLRDKLVKIQLLSTPLMASQLVMAAAARVAAHGFGNAIEMLSSGNRQQRLFWG